MLISPVSLSCLTLLSHSPVSVSCLTPPVSRLLSHVCLMFHVFLTSPVIPRSPGSHLLSHVSSLMSHVSCLLSPVSCLTSPFTCLLSHIFCFLPSVADPDPDPDLWNLYHFPGSRSGSVSIIGWIQNPDLDLYQMIRIRIQQKSLKTENNLKYF